MRSSIRNRLLLTFLILMVVTGAGTLFAIERTLAEDLVSSLKTRLTLQGQAVATWMSTAGHPHNLAPRLGAVTGAHITVVGADGLVLSDSTEPQTVGRPIGNAIEVARARKGQIGSQIRRIHPGEPLQYLVAVPADLGRVVRLAVPVEDVIETRSRMRNRMLVGAGFGLILSLVLSWFLIRAITRPLQSMTRAAEQFAAGEYEATAPTDAGGELGVLARAMKRMAGEIKSRIGELTEQRDLLSVVFGGLVEGVVVVDETGRVVLVNEVAQPLVGDGDLPASLAALVERARAGEEADGELELVGRAVRVSARPLPAQATPNVALPSESAGAIVVLYDVTRMRALEAVRREFLSNVAHELRTPVTSISGYAETLLGGGIDGELSKEFLETIHRNAQRISTLVSDLLVLDTLEARDAAVGERGTVPLAKVVGDAARTTRGAIADADIEIDIADDVAVLGTREGLDHVVQNLIDNAAKYARTKVVVRAIGSDDGKHVQLVVADRGPGIPKGHEARIFERFYRLDAGRSSDRGGSGLGLAIVKSQVEAMGGRIWVEDNGPGARFVVELDAAQSS